MEKADETYESPPEKHRGRLEQRKVEVFNDFKTTDDGWELICDMVKVTRTRDVLDTKTKSYKNGGEVSYYISTEKFSAKQYHKGIRNHWFIENKNHYVRDKTLGEDSSRIRKNPVNMGILRSFALNVFRANKVKNISHEIYENTMDLNKVLEYNYV